eukprot:TRINITY_DN31134_c0_g1_i1.p1 TRINITY_DN31134_c0_g1~~TRINITY_DN31134_c0_g1_i1.p1  ORF type:complete len:621 (-),score=150.74 TRINITY_DN31134_c0_g1_i1:38-1900(-)
MLASGFVELPEDLKKLQEEVLAGFSSGSEDAEGDDDDRESSLSALFAAASQFPVEASSASSSRGPPTLSETAVLVAAGEAELESVQQLVYRHQRLASLTIPGTVDMLRLAGSLEVLSLSHNELTDIQPLSLLTSLVEVNLNFNRIEDLRPLHDCDLLVKVFAAHNRVSSVSGLELGCPQLRELSLFANRLGGGKELLKTLGGLPELRSLDIGENDGCLSAPSQRRELLRLLPRLEFLDGQETGNLILGGAGDSTCDREQAEQPAARQPSAEAEPAGSCSPAPPAAASSSAPSFNLAARPGTAPAASSSSRPPRVVGAAAQMRPPPLPKGAIGCSFAAMPLTGQKLRSARANRMDEVLTSSREPSPPASDSGGARPSTPLQVLQVHGEALRRHLETQLVERENLRFQVRLLEKDAREQTQEHFQKLVDDLEVENRSARAIEDESRALTQRSEELDVLMARLKDEVASQVSGATALEARLPEEGEDLEELRWECRRLQKRLDRARDYNRELLEDAERARLQSRSQRGSSGAGQPSLKQEEEPNDAEDPEMEEMLAQNDLNLRRLQGEFRDTATALAAKSKSAGVSKKPPAGGRSADRVDVLTIGGGADGRDVEWHQARKARQ